MITIGDREIETTENRLLHLALEGDREATRRYANLYLSGRTWERTLSVEHHRKFLDQVHDAQTWLAANHA